MITNAKIVYLDRIREGSILLEGDCIISTGEMDVPEGCEIIDAGGLFVGPGLIDEHVHGYHQYGEGFDIIDNTMAVADAHLKHGVTSMTPSPSYSLRLGKYLSIIEQCNKAMDEGNNSIIGIHLEGPYINYHMGAGRKYAWKYSDEVFSSLFEAAKGHVLHCTYAPEMSYAESVEAIINKYGSVMDIGHTQADPESIYRSVSKGLKIVTHLFDATGNYKGIHASDMTGDPQDGVSYVTLGIPNLYYEIISDVRGIHVTKSGQRLALKCAGEDHIILVSDCTYHKREDDNPGEYPDSDLRSCKDINIGKNGNLFGSRLTVADCAANFMKATGADIRVTFKCASTNSAAALGLSSRFGSIAAGKKANLVFVDDAFRVQNVIFEGRQIPEVRTTVFA